MAFRELQRERAFRSTNPHVTVGAYKSGGKRPTTVIGIPRAMLRDAGLSDLPGARVALMIGDGEDAGKIAIIPGASSSLAKVGNGKNRMQIAFTGLAAQLRKVTNCSAQVGNRQIIISLPVGFADPVPVQLEVAA